MERLSFLILPFILISTAYGQNTELSAHLNSGLYSFGGESATDNSFIIVSDAGSEGNYTNNPYGSKKTFSYGFSAQYQRITDYKLIYGLQGGYELLRSQVTIDDVSGDFPEPPSSASGQTIFNNGFITFYPNIGRRFNYSNLDIDLSIGPEVGYNMVSRERGESTTNNDIIIETDRKRNSPDTDVRLRSSLTVYFNSWGVSTGYSYGVRNYSGDLTSGNRKRFSRYIRFGVTYRMN